MGLDLCSVHNVRKSRLKYNGIDLAAVPHIELNINSLTPPMIPLYILEGMPNNINRFQTESLPISPDGKMSKRKIGCSYFAITLRMAAMSVLRS